MSNYIKFAVQIIFIILICLLYYSYTPSAALTIKNNEPQMLSYDGAIINNPLRFPGTAIENNQWGAKTQGIPVSLSIYDSGWTFNVSEDSEYLPAIYPEIIWGWKPWTEYSTTSELPIEVKDIKGLTIDYSLYTITTGLAHYNQSFDFWITRESRPKEVNIQTEIMIWTASEGPKNPAGGSYGGIFEIEKGFPCEIWIADKNDPGLALKWNIITFKFVNSVFSGTINLVPYLEETLKRGLISRVDYLASIELGNEIWYGRGQTLVKEFKPNLTR